MNTALGWDPTAPAAALRRVQARLLTPGSLAWFERLTPDGSDPWTRFEALILAAMSGTSAPAPAGVSATARPYPPSLHWPAPLQAPKNAVLAQAESSAPSVTTGIRQERPTADVRPSSDTSFAARRARRAGALAGAVPAACTAATDSLAAHRAWPVKVPTPAPAPAAAAAAAATPTPAPAPVISLPRAHAPLAGSAALPAPASTQQRRQPVAARPALSSTLAAVQRPAEPPLRPPSARVIGWPLARQQAPGGELSAESRRTRVVEGLPALRSLMQSAVVQGRQADTTPAPDTPSATAPVATPHATLLARHAEPTVPTTPRPFGSPDPFADDALIDRVIDRLDERLRELSIRHLGFTGGLGA